MHVFFFQAEDGIRDLTVTGVQDVCSSDLVSREPRPRRRFWLPGAPNLSTGNRLPFPAEQRPFRVRQRNRSEEHTSELQSQSNLVCRLLLEKKKTRVRCYTRNTPALVIPIA